MTTTPYARLLTSVNGDAAVAGARTVTGGETIQFSYESTVAWPGTPLTRIEFYSYPEGWTGPGGAWTEEETSIVGPTGSTITYTAFVYRGNSAPASFVMPSTWGKYLCQLIVNNGVKGGAQSEDVRDTACGLEILSSQGLHDLAWRETSQFSTETWRNWEGDHAANLRTLNTALAAALALSSTLPAAVGTAAIGVGTTAARADHVHAHGTQLGGTLHANADGSTAGFLTSTHYTYLTTITPVYTAGNIAFSAAGATTIGKAPVVVGAGLKTTLSGQKGEPGSIGGELELAAGEGGDVDADEPGALTLNLGSDGVSSGTLSFKGGTALGVFQTCLYLSASSTISWSTTKNSLGFNAAVDLRGRVGGVDKFILTAAALTMQAGVNLAADTLSVGGVAMTSAATASAPMIRDGAGRAKVADPSAVDDIDTKGARDTAVAAAVGKIVMSFGASSLGTGSFGPAYIWPPGTAVSTITATQLYIKNPTGVSLKLAGTLEIAQVAGVGAGTTTFTIQVGTAGGAPADTAMTITLDNAATDNTAAVAGTITWGAGEKMSIKCARGGGVAGAATNVRLQLCWIAA